MLHLSARDLSSSKFFSIMLEFSRTDTMSELGNHRFPSASRHADNAIGNSSELYSCRMLYAYVICVVSTESGRVSDSEGNVNGR